MSRRKECWVVTDGRAGIESQALGLAEEVARYCDIHIVKKIISVQSPWRHLPYPLWGDPFDKLSREYSLLRPPFPDLWIGCGRLSIPFGMALKKRHAATFTVQLQRPRAPTHAFDLVVPPSHDQLSGDNVFPIIGSPNRITSQKLTEAGEQLAPYIERLPKPRIAVLLGGSNRYNRVNEFQAARLQIVLGNLLAEGFGLMVTSSRRTPSVVRTALTGFQTEAAWFSVQQEGLSPPANPYFGMLDQADHIMVTDDSVNMAAEAAATGKPVHIYHWRGEEMQGVSQKFRRFHNSLMEYGATRAFSGIMDEWRYRPLQETTRAAKELICRWRAFQGA